MPRTTRSGGILFLVDDAILPNDPTPNVIDESDYEYWKDSLRRVVNPAGPGSATRCRRVPEPRSSLWRIGIDSQLASQFRLRNSS